MRSEYSPGCFSQRQVSPFLTVTVNPVHSTTLLQSISLERLTPVPGGLAEERGQRVGRPQPLPPWEPAGEKRVPKRAFLSHTLGNPRERSGFRNVRFSPTDLGARGKEAGSQTCVSLPHTWEPAGKKRVPERAFLSLTLGSPWERSRFRNVRFCPTHLGARGKEAGSQTCVCLPQTTGSRLARGSGSDGSGSDGSGGIGSGSDGSGGEGSGGEGSGCDGSGSDDLGTDGSGGDGSGSNGSGGEGSGSDGSGSDGSGGDGSGSDGSGGKGPGSDGSGSDGSGGDGSGSNGSVLSYIKCTFSPPHNLALSSSVPKHDENTQQGERTLI